MKDNNTINIGDNNKIVNSNIGNNTKSDNKEKWYSKITWKIIVPIAVAVASTAILVWLGLK